MKNISPKLLKSIAPYLKSETVARARLAELIKRAAKGKATDEDIDTINYIQSQLETSKAVKLAGKRSETADRAYEKKRKKLAELREKAIAEGEDSVINQLRHEKMTADQRVRRLRVWEAQALRAPAPSARTLAKELGVAERTICNDLKWLEETGNLMRIGATLAVTSEDEKAETLAHWQFLLREVYEFYRSMTTARNRMQALREFRRVMEGVQKFKLDCGMILKVGELDPNQGGEGELTPAEIDYDLDLQELYKEKQEESKAG